MFINCFVWVLYGCLVGDLPVLIPNSTGLLASVYCVYIYESYSRKSIPKTYYIAICISIFGSILAFFKMTQAIGLLGDFLAVLMMGSPLSTLFTVLNEKSTAAMPFMTSLATWGNAFSWSTYGLVVVNDPLVFIS